VHINCWIIKGVVTHGARCVQCQNGSITQIINRSSTMSHFFVTRLLLRWHRAKHLDSTSLSITLRPVVQRYHTFVTHITHNYILPLKFRVDGFWSSSPKTSSSRLLLRSPYTLIGDVTTHAILPRTLLKTLTLGQHCLHAIANSFNVNLLAKRTPHWQQTSTNANRKNTVHK